MSNTVRKDVKKMLAELKRQGCTVSIARNGHWKVELEGCKSIYIPSSPGDQRVIPYTRIKVRRYLGIQL